MTLKVELRMILPTEVEADGSSGGWSQQWDSRSENFNSISLTEATKISLKV
jgi:hypothetical protein